MKKYIQAAIKDFKITKQQEWMEYGKQKRNHRSRTGKFMNLLKKGNTTHCKNWSSITILRNTSKLLSGIILD